MVSSTGEEVVGISVDSSGVDDVLLDTDGKLISPVFHYRDSRNKASSQVVQKRLEWKDIYEETGLQLIDFNTVFQLVAETPERLSRASTTQLYDPRKRTWFSRLADLAGLRVEQLPEVVSSGTPFGPFRGEIA